MADQRDPVSDQQPTIPSSVSGGASSSAIDLVLDPVQRRVLTYLRTCLDSVSSKSEKGTSVRVACHLAMAIATTNSEFAHAFCGAFVQPAGVVGTSSLPPSVQTKEGVAVELEGNIDISAPSIQRLDIEQNEMHYRFDFSRIQNWGEQNAPSVLQECFGWFATLSLRDRNRVMKWALTNDGLLNACIDYSLSTSAGLIEDEVCQWLYVLVTAENKISTAVITSSSPIPQPAPAVLATPGHLDIASPSVNKAAIPDPFMGYSRSIPRPGIDTVLLAVYKLSCSSGSILKSTSNSTLMQRLNGVHEATVDLYKLSHNPYGTSTLAIDSSLMPGNINNNRSVISASGTARKHSLDSKSSTSLRHSPVIDDVTLVDVSRSSFVCTALLLYVDLLSNMSTASQQQFCYMCTRLCDNSQLKEVEFWLSSAGECNWTCNWQHATYEAMPHSYSINSSILEIMLTGLTFCLSYPHHRELALLCVRAIHCRAVERLIPEILLKTTALLEAVEE